MRIAMFTDTYIPQINGVVTSINLFKNELEKFGHEVFVFAPKDKTLSAKEEKQLGKNNIFYFKSVKYPLAPEHQMAYSFSGHLKKFKDLKFDIIHSHTPFTLGMLALFLAKQYKIPMVHTYHTLFSEYLHYFPFTKNINLWIVKNASKKYCKKCDLIICPSESMRRELQNYGVNQEIDIVPTGVADDFPKNIEDPNVFRRNKQIPEDIQVIVYAGRIAKEKNLEFLLKVYREVLKVREHILFVVLGDGDNKKNIEKMAADLKIDHKMKFTGYVSDKKELASWYSLADVFVFSSMTETQGLVVLEAMSVGTPVVAVNAMGVADIIADNLGGYASSPDIMEFALKLMRLLSSKEMRKLKGEEALAKAALLDMKHMANRMIVNYQRLIDVATKV